MTESSVEAQAISLLSSLASDDLLERQGQLAKFADLGPEAIPVLLGASDNPDVQSGLRELVRGLAEKERERGCSQLVRALRRDRDDRGRLLALGLLGDLLSDLSGFIDKAVEIALDGSETAELRARALRTLAAARLDAEQARELGKLLDIIVLGATCPSALRNAAFHCFTKHAPLLAVVTTMKQLDPFLIDPHPEIRGHALALLGEIGDLDAIERMCLVPSTNEEIAKIQAAVGRILQRPTNLLALRWEHFEHFVAHLLRKLGREQVETTRAVVDDGIDVVCYARRENLTGPTRERWIVQCKRWTKKRVDVDVLEQLIERKQTYDAKHALLITTSDFSTRAREFGAKHANNMELVSGTDLLRLLDQHFGPGRYTIRARD